MTLTKKDILIMRRESRIKIEEEMDKYRQEYMEEFIEAARKLQLKAGAEQVIEDAAAPGREEQETITSDSTGY